MFKQLMLLISVNALFFFIFFFQDDGILVVPTVADPPLKLNVKKQLAAEFHDRAFALSSIASMSGCCQVTYCLLRQFLSRCFSFCSLVDYTSAGYHSIRKAQ
jgi:hypothetical protein